MLRYREENQRENQEINVMHANRASTLLLKRNEAFTECNRTQAKHETCVSTIQITNSNVE